MHLNVHRQLPDGISPPRRAPVKDMYDGALKERLGIVYVAVDVFCGMVARNSVQDGMNDRAHLVPRVDLWHRSNDNTSFEKKREGGGIEHNT